MDLYKIVPDCNLLNGILRMSSRISDLNKSDRHIARTISMASSHHITYNSTTYNLMISHFGVRGDIDQAFHWFDRMEKACGHGVDYKTFTALASACLQTPKIGEMKDER
jgi:pentatricopeptide repeat protein